KLKFVYIELPKFQKEAHQLETHFDKWLYVFTHLAELQERPKALQERVFQKIFEIAESAGLGDEGRDLHPALFAGALSGLGLGINGKGR
ncbi:MAG: PD-(D/E)XK nuclease family transposase, partial [Bacteroidota bacterium]